jgi:hypothetical protein
MAGGPTNGGDRRISIGKSPTGYLVLNVRQGTLKHHAGSYDWQTVIGATGGKIGF